MAERALSRGEVQDIPFATWPRQWISEHPQCWIWASNRRMAEVSAAITPDIRGPMGECVLPSKAGDRVEIIVFPMPDGSEVSRCELVLAQEALSSSHAGILDTAISQIMQVQRIDAPDSLCYLTQLYLMFRDWLNARRGLPLLIEGQPFLPADRQSWSQEQQAICLGSTALPVTSMERILDFWVSVGGTLLAGVPGPVIAEEDRPCYNQIPMRVLSPQGVASVYGVPLQSAHGYSMSQSGNAWTITFGGISHTYSRLTGIVYIARLIEMQGHEIKALELASFGVQQDSMTEGAFVEGLSIGGSDQLQVNEHTLAAVEERLREIELEIAEDHADSAAKDDLLDEQAKIQDYLRGTTGMGGRPRVFDGESEKARKSVWSAIRYARGRLAGDLPELEVHLTAHLKVGVECSYHAAPEIDWTINWASERIL